MCFIFYLRAKSSILRQTKMNQSERKELKEGIELLMNRLGLTQSQLAEKLGLSRSSISSILSPDRPGGSRSLLVKVRETIKKEGLEGEKEKASQDWEKEKGVLLERVDDLLARIDYLERVVKAQEETIDTQKDSLDRADRMIEMNEKILRDEIKRLKKLNGDDKSTN